MKAYELGVTTSYNRPRVSNDNPFAESLFRTCKYRPDWPSAGFKSLDEARTWVLKFTRWYNYEHKHSKLRFVTPHQRHTGQDVAILAQRKARIEAANLCGPIPTVAPNIFLMPGPWVINRFDWTPEIDVWPSELMANSLNSCLTKSIVYRLRFFGGLPRSGLIVQSID